ncbi:unnamed protein product [Cuscuta campestris]|uniref:RNA helicase n=2 Tax=Cuscuta campestris TaxID=132261 RepID=A0A484KZQ1_9ASTE|nr:unnamed protein product [Cuscuta campestris]
MYSFRHWSEKTLDEMSEGDWRIFCAKFNINYKGARVPPPMRNWSESKLSAELLNGVQRAGYEKPSPIQMAAVPIGLEHRDLIGIAPTGSGMTAAFVLPMLMHVYNLMVESEKSIDDDDDDQGPCSPYALVLAPTRAHVLQIEEETVKFAPYLGINIFSILAGQPIDEQGPRIRQGRFQVVIASPFRLLHCLQRRYLVLNQCNYVVLDQADRMIDMGFKDQVTEILDSMPRLRNNNNMKPENLDGEDEEEVDGKQVYRTTQVFSATMPWAVERLARKYLRNPIVVRICTEEEANEPPITQHVIMMKPSEKSRRLRILLDELGDGKTAIVFTNTKSDACTIAKFLGKDGYRVALLHWGMEGEQRRIILDGLKNNEHNVLVATNAAAYGIDVPHVAHVINYDMPGDIDTYTNRISRVGGGISTTFLTLDDTDVFCDLKQLLVQSNCLVPPELAQA